MSNISTEAPTDAEIQAVNLDQVFAEAANTPIETSTKIEPTEGKKPKKEREGLKTLKKPRGPHIMTEKRKLAFEKCQAARREKIALKKANLAVAVNV